MLTEGEPDCGLEPFSSFRLVHCWTNKPSAEHLRFHRTTFG